MTEGRFADTGVRVLLLLAVGAALAVGAFLALRRADARWAREAEARERSLRQARDQQAATAEILGAIAASPPDLQVVLDTIARNAARVCDGLYAVVFRFDGTQVRPAAHHGLSSARLEFVNRTFPKGLDDEGAVARAIRDASVVHYPDILGDAGVPRGLRNLALAEGFRSMVIVPMLHEGLALGTLNVSRPEGGFTERQIQLLRSFADQAVIAIENVRLFQELQARNLELTESLEQQTATAEILRVISSSPTDLAPVMDAVVRNAARLARADHALIGEAAEGHMRWLATAGCPLVTQGPPISRELPSGRAILDCQTTQVEDVTELTVDFPGVRRAYDEFGVRTILATPLVREGLAIGVLLVRRTRVQPFTDKEIELLRTFADQAVIAIENVRLFQELQTRNRELTEALEQQTATGEILQVISSSPTDTQPVFDAIVRSAARLGDAAFAGLVRLDGRMLMFDAQAGMSEADLEIHRRSWPRELAPDSAGGRAILSRGIVHIADAREDPGYSVSSALMLGYRTALAVPLMREGAAIGAIALWRRDVRPFSDKQIQLVRTFADQAVIAIENVRLFKELQVRNRELTESLEQQTATSEVLGAISRSPTDLQPIYQTILANVTRLCDANIAALFLWDGEFLNATAHQNATPEFAAHLDRGRVRPSRETPTRRAALERRVVHVVDVLADPEWVPSAAHRLENPRTVLSVPMLRDAELVGVITAWRREVRPFSDRQIALVKTFADQALIAIENVRLFQELQSRNRELTESLEQKTATGEILRVISSSPTDVQPVFDTIVASAARLCGGLFGAIFRMDGELLDLAGSYSIPAEFVERFRRTFPARPHRGLLAMRAVLDGVLVQSPDLENDAEFRNQEMTQPLGMRSMVGVPMLRDGVAIGVITVGRSAVGSFPASQIEVLRTFADQAVIAIENVRLFQELQRRNRELTESLEQQTATGAILRVMSGSPTDIQPVLDVVAESATRLCDARDVTIALVDGDVLKVVASHGVLARWWPDEGVPISRGSVTGRAVVDRQAVHIHDLTSESDEEFPQGKVYQRLGGHRTNLAVPLLREEVAIGVLAMRRGEVRPFTDQQIGLLKTFADQAVIAIENVRLFQELQARNRDLTEALEQQTATSEILRVISQSPTDVQPVFDIIAQWAVSLCDAEVSVVSRFDGTLLQLAALHGITREGVDAVRAVFPMPLDAETMASRAFRSRAVIHVEDVLADPRYQVKDTALAGRWRGGLAVPMLRGTEVIGVIFVGRSTARLFTDSQVELLKTFTDQAVIAIENVRLFQELQARTRELSRSVQELTALGEVSRAVSATLDVETVLQTVVSHASQLAAADGGSIFEYDEATQEFQLRATHAYAPELAAVLQAMPPRMGEGMIGSAAARREPMQVADIAREGAYQSRFRDVLIRVGYRALLAVPLVREDHVIGALTVNRKAPGEFPPEVIELLRTFATQSALAIQNARLFREIETKSRELEVASRHKSQFLANMSHELRTPLNAILGYTELLVDGIYGDLSPKAGDVMTRIDRSGKHLLGLINDVLDLSKIEAGQLELGLADYSLAEIVNTVVTQVESLAAEKGLILQAAVAPDLPAGRGDERRLAQVLLNLVGNAIKFTEVGSVRVAAYRDGDAFVVSVADTGPGIAEADRQRIFEEFQQADSSSTRKKGGTGLGLSIAKRIVELHGGQLWVDSAVGRGSTFSFRVPVRVERQAARA